MPRLSHGLGAEATVLTKKITSEGVLPNELQALVTRSASAATGTVESKHRSKIILIEFVEADEILSYKFYLYEDNESGNTDAPVLLASQRYVKVTKEVDQSLFFGDPTIITTGRKKSKSKSKPKEEHKEPDISWRDSDAKKLLYKDLRRGNVPAKAKDQHNKSTMKLKNIYVMRPEYLEYRYDMFSSRLSSLRSTFSTNTHRAEDDLAAFDVYVINNEVSTMSHKGYIQWQGSESQRLVQEDIKDGTMAEYAEEKFPKMKFWQSRPEYYDEFPLHVFRDKIYQEIGTAKYLHTLKVKGKNQTYNYRNTSD
jgi:hypothetical protein